jgi:hypothetical protein
MWGFTVGIVFVLMLLLTLAGLWLLRTLGEYAMLCSDEHFREVASQLPAVKQAALEKIFDSVDAAACTPEDPRGMRTSAGLNVLYLIGREENRFHHCLSVSASTRAQTAHVVCDVFICFIARLLGLGMDRLHLQIWRKSVYHAEVMLSVDEHEQFVARPVTLPSPEELAVFRREWSRSRRIARQEDHSPR